MKLSDVQRIKRQKQLSDASKKAPEVKNKIVPIKTSTTEEVIHEDDMKGMSVKSEHKRPTKAGAGMTKKGVEAYRRQRQMCIRDSDMQQHLLQSYQRHSLWVSCVQT